MIFNIFNKIESEITHQKENFESHQLKKLNNPQVYIRFEDDLYRISIYINDKVEVFEICFCFEDNLYSLYNSSLLCDPYFHLKMDDENVDKLIDKHIKENVTRSFWV